MPPTFQIITFETLKKLLDKYGKVTIYNCYPVFIPFMLLFDHLPLPRFLNRIVTRIIEISRKRWPEWKSVITGI